MGPPGPPGPPSPPGPPGPEICKGIIISFILLQTSQLEFRHYIIPGGTWKGVKSQ